MKHIHQNPVVAGVGTAVGAVIFASVLLGCAPGKLPCDDPAWKEVCESDGGGGVVNGGAPGGSGGMSGNSGGMGGSSGGMGGGAGISASTTINCSEYPTIGDMDKFFAMRCGAAAACHAMAIPWTDMKAPEVWKRLADKNSTVSCKDAKLIDTKTWSNSVILAKTKTPVACPPGGSNPGLPMPPANMMPMMAPLSAAETTCLENYLKKIAGM